MPDTFNFKDKGLLIKGRQWFLYSVIRESLLAVLRLEMYGAFKTDTKVSTC
ncbi:MAG: hypothetical protein ACR2PP_00760 [Psychrobacter sp.]